jgi:hypothetical protein
MQWALLGLLPHRVDDRGRTRIEQPYGAAGWIEGSLDGILWFRLVNTSPGRYVRLSDCYHPFVRWTYD